MQIQRVQSLYLLLASVMMALFIFIPFGYSQLEVEGVEQTVAGWYPYESAALWVPSAIGALLALADIFLFKNFSLQKLVAKIDIIVILLSIILTVYFLVAGFKDLTPGDVVMSTRWGGGGLLLLASLIAVWMALNHISADERLLRSMDRIR